MKGNIKRVLAASALLVAVLMIAVSVSPGSAAYAQGNNGNGSGNSKAPFVKCVDGKLILNVWKTNGSNNNQGMWSKTVLGTCPANTESILNQLAQQNGMTRAQLDALVAARFGSGGIPQGFDLQSWFSTFMANRNANNTSNSTSANNANSNGTTANSASTTGTNQQGSTTGANQQGSSTGSSSKSGSNTNSSTGSNGGVGGAGAPATLPTTGSALPAVSPLVLALGALLILIGFGVYQVSATR